MPEVIEIQGRNLEYELLREVSGEPRPVMVFLHEGLGSLAMWKDFPASCARACQCDALVYSRYGHGQSGRLTEPRRVDFMHDEALKVLPQLLAKLNIERPFLFGHSDGASIALIHAAHHALRGIILLAPHVMVEDLAIDSIQATTRAYQTTDLPQRLGRYHADPDSTFQGWSDIWLNPAFRAWDIQEYLPGIACPILSIQGVDDEYGTMGQVYAIANGVRQMDVVELNHCGHSPHRDQPALVTQAAADFVRRNR
jgi:pimeloyl-ACP methyl ester carboxylesterase